MINLLSDTLTKPTAPMLKAMMAAEVGDDVFGEDPSINRLERTVAERFGMESALFCPSGTMTNQIAIKMHTRPLDEVICDVNSHVYQYEVGGYAYHSGVGIQLLEGCYGKITAAQVAAAIRPDFAWLPKTRLVVLENTCNRGGGSIYSLPEIQPITALTRERGLALHLDGARLFNALVETGESPEQWGQHFDSISLCLSKGLGAPVGSLLIGNASFIHEARRVRKAMGGGMRQAGYLAAAGLYALDHHIERLMEDHEHAHFLEAALRESPYVENIRPVASNIILYDIKAPYQAADFLQELRKSNVIATGFGPSTIRFVTHLDVTRQMIDSAVEIIKSVRLSN